jgi:hypothetical protein
LIVNDDTYGGSDTPPNLNTPLPVAITSLGNSSDGPAAHILLHESGHAIGGLGDEYTNSYHITPIACPNATQNNSLDQIPWVAWITNYDQNDFGYMPQIPTPVAGNEELVGLFEGAEYNATGWYRPMSDCIMNTIEAAGFCSVCSEAIVKAIYQKVDSIDSFAPATNNPALTTTNAFPFSIVPLQPATHSLNLQWFTNGMAVPGATNSVFTLFPQNFTNGPCSVQVQTLDTTLLPYNPPTNQFHPYLVLDDPNHYLSNSVSWNVTIGLTALQIISPRWLANAQFTFTVAGTAPYGFVIQASTNLTSWVSLSTNTLSAGLFNYTNAAGFSQRYYRTVFTP